MYSNRFVLTVLINGTPLPELDNGTIIVPFNAEYALRLRNKNNRRAVVKFFIDGEEVSGGGYIIPANDVIDIKRHSVKDAAFKFVGLDSPDAFDFGKNGPNHNKTKGVIEARFFLEKEKPVRPQVVEHHHHHNHWNTYPAPYIRPRPYYPEPHIMYCATSADNLTRGAETLSFNAMDSAPQTFEKTSYRGLNAVGDNTKSLRARSASLSFADSDDDFSCLAARSETPTETSRELLSAASKAKPELKDGCTVEGGGTGQSFSHSYIDYDPSLFTTLKVFLQGYEETEEGQKAEVVRVADALSALTAKSEKAAKKNHVTQEPDAPTQAELDARAAEEEEARLRKLLAEAKSKKLREELAELGVTA